MVVGWGRLRLPLKSPLWPVTATHVAVTGQSKISVEAAPLQTTRTAGGSVDRVSGHGSECKSNFAPDFYQ